jgi:hypothetical protein
MCPRLRSWTACAVVLLAGSAAARGGTVALLPGKVTLDGPKAFQRLLVQRRDGDAWSADLTAKAVFRVDNPAIARVEPDGTVRPIANGKTTLIAQVGGEEARAEVVVSQFEKDEPWSFANHVEPVLTRAGCNQGACHGAAAGKNGFRLTLRGYSPEVDYDVLTRQALGRRVVKTAPAESLMLLKPTGALRHGGGVRFGADSLEYRVLAEWIASGTPRPSANDPTMKSLTVYPEAARLRPGDHQSVVVRATYSDGRSADVTGWAKFASTDETVARVDENGKVKVEGRGEASVTVWYSSLVARATITVPSELPINPKVFADAARRNLIDDKNLAKLASLGLPPSPDCGDAAFLRRATLDATGTLPSAEAFEAFVADRAPAKRAKLVDRLLAGPEYVDYWAYKWSDLFLVSSKKLPAPAMWAFYGAIRRSVAEDVPWDRFARAIVTAKGDSQSNGLANYFVLHRDPIDLTESASMAFLGLSLTCARCHNHPMEKWTQDQYYGMANLFARVKLKDGGTTGDVVVMPAPEGDIHHPRTGAVIPPQPLDAKALPVTDRGDRREAFADWLASKDNPYFARAVVNRVWRNFFSRGLVDPEDDLRATNPASDEPLMEALVADFIAHGYDIKHLIRTIMTSAVYARSSEPVPGNAGDSKFLSHYAAERLPAEVLLDAISQVTGVPTSFAGYPSGWRSLQLPDVKPESTFLDAFGRPIRESTCSCERSAEPSMAQALSLLNGAMLNGKLRAERGVVSKLLASGASDEAIVDRLFASALTRRPTAAERERLKAALAGAVAGIRDAKESAQARRAAVEDLYWATLTSKEFLFNH